MKKTYIIFFNILLCTITKIVFSQGNTCATASSLTLNASCSYQSANITGGNTASGATPTFSCYAAGSSQVDIWYTFTGNGNNITVQYLPASNDAAMQVYSGSCGSLTQVGCSDACCSGAVESVSFSSVNGTTYYVRIVRYGGGTMNGQICAFSVTPPSNNLCSSATSLPCGTTNLAGTTAGTSNLAHGTSCFMGNYGVWYTFVGDGQSTTISSTAVFDHEMSISSGNCGFFTNLACLDNAGTGGTETTTFISTLGVNYYIYISHYSSGSTTTGTFTISRTCTAAPTPPANDNCIGATLLVSNTSCNNTAGTVNGATASAQTNGCWGTADDDVWYQFVATATSHDIAISNVSGSVTDMYHSVYAGSCGSPGTELVCSDPNTSTVTGLTIGQTYYIRVYTYTSTGGQNTTFNICVTGCNTTPANDNCSGAIALTMNAYGSCASTSAGNVSCATPSGTSMGSCFGNPDDDIWYSFVATSTTHSVTLTTSSGFDAYMMLYSGTCGSLNPLQCSDPNNFTASGLTIGQTYYIRVYSYSAGAPTNGNITMCVAGPAACPANLGAGNVAIASLPYNGTGQTTCGAGNDITASNAATCGSTLYFADADKVYTFTPATSGQVTVTLNSTQSWTAMMLYDGCPFSANCVANVQTSSSGSKSFCVSVVAGTTYYLVVDGWGTSGSCITTFSLTITAPSAGIPNDLPCNATALTLGSSVTGDNTCTSGTGEPGVPSCWSSGNLNTVWYSFVAPSSGTVYIQTTANTITNTQIALYSGACGSLSIVDCNQNPPTGCTGTATSNSVINATGLTGGATYYVRLDGRNDNVGTFSIIVDNGTSGTSSPVPGQDCAIPLVVCNSVMTIGNPGYANTGNVCDFTGSGNCTSGELNSVWYQINIAATGNFNFTLMPNDGNNSSCGSETDYDYLLWKISGSGTTTDCNTISSSSSTALLACNFDSYGVTGIAPSGNAPAPINSCFNSAFEPTVSVTAGDVLYLVIQNYSGSTQGFVLDMTSSGAGVVNYTAPPTVYWTGGANTTWTNATNWGSCSTVPSCAVNAVVTAASATQPIITGTENVKDLTINPGATLTLNAGAVLNVCGNFVNNGNLVCSPTSTIIFNNAAVAQSISGSLTGTNKFGHLTITKTGSAVTLNNNIDIGGNFTTSNVTSVFNSNNYDVKVAGNFVNNAGNTTYTNTGTLGTLTFNGTAAQTYTQGSSQLDLNNVVMSHTSTGVTLLTNMHIKSTTGTLTLTQGKIITNAFEVNVANTAPTCVSTGNTTSFVQGNLRRSLLPTGSYDFPVGHATPGYQRANINFTAATSIGNLLARFDVWGTNPIQGGTECGMTYNQLAENNGYWTITANANPTTGTYNTTLYPLNATNTAGMAGWTVIKAATAAGPWILDGTCVASTATQVMRNGMNGFSAFAAAQSLVPLPIELLSFSGKNEGKRNLLEWSTATEINNDFFTLEHSEDGINFTEFATIDGAGNSQSVINYSTYDNSPYNGTTYYRLKQTDFNGDFSHSTIIAIENKLNTVTLDNIHPNPTSNDIYFDFYTPINGEIQIQVLDYTGRVVVNEFINLTEGKTTLSSKMSALAKGVYSLRVTFETTGFTEVTKIIKQ